MLIGIARRFCLGRQKGSEWQKLPGRSRAHAAGRWRETARGTVASRELGSRGCLRATSGNTADTAWAVLPPARAPTPPPRQALAGIQIRSARRIRAGAASARRDRMPASRRSALASRARNAVRQDAGATHAVAGWRQVDRASSAPHPRGIKSRTKVKRQPKADQSSAGRCPEREPVAILPGRIGSIAGGRAEGIVPRSTRAQTPESRGNRVARRGQLARKIEPRGLPKD